MIDLHEDLHVHSTFSDGKHDIVANVRTASMQGLHTIGLVDHARRDTDWLSDYAGAVDRLRCLLPIDVTCGVEVKILDTAGNLDMPRLPRGIREIVVADHQVPLGHDCLSPQLVREMIATGSVGSSEVVGSILEATARAAERHDSVLIAHLFSVLPKAGIDPSTVPDDDVRALGRRLAAAGARVEISERWRCPSEHVAALLVAEGVELVASTDSHRKDTIGVYDYVARVAASLS